MPILYNVKTKKPELLDGEDLQRALISGTHAYTVGERVNATSPDGEFQSIDATKAPEAIQAGWKIETPTERAVRGYVEENKGIGGALKVFGGQFLDEAAFSLPELIMDKTQDPFEIAKREAIKKEHGVANTLGGVGGFGASLLVGGPLFKLGEKAATKTAGLLAEKIVASSAGEVAKRSALQASKGALRNLAAEGAGRAVEGAIISAPHAITETMLGDPEAAAESLLLGMGVGSVFGVGSKMAGDLLKLGKKGVMGALEYGGRKIESTADARREIAAKIAKTVTGVDEDAILHYADNVDRANLNFQKYEQAGGGNAIEGLKDEIDNVVGDLTTKLEVAKANEIRLKGELDQAYNIEKQRLSQTRAPDTLVPEIMGELENLKSRLGSKSDELFDALSASDIQIDVPQLKRFVTQQIDALKPTKGAAVFGDAAKAEEQRLLRLREDLNTLPKKLSPVEAKQIIKQMDPDLNYNQGAGEFNELSQKNAKAFRKYLNDKFRTGTTADILDEMSRISQVLNESSKKFGKLESAVSNVNNIFGPKGKINQEILEKLSAVSGKDFVGQLRGYQEAKGLLDKAKVQDIKDVLVPNLKKQYDDALKEVESYQLWAEELKKLGPNQTQSLLRNQAFKNANIENRKALEFLSQMTGKDYLEILKDINVVDAFSKERTNGSRRTLLGSVLGSLVAGPLGTAIGGAAGAGTDIYGGKILKSIIDGNRDVSGILFAEKAMKKVADKLDTIPESIKSLSKKSPVGGKSASLNAIIRLVDGEEPRSTPTVEQRAKKLQEFNKKASIWVSNPDEAIRQTSMMVAKLAETGAPQLGAMTQQKYLQAINYIFSQAPKPPRPTSPLQYQYEWKPSDQQLSAFEQKVQTVLDPFSVFDELKRGTLTRSHIDALRVVYPKIYSNMRNRMQKEVLENPTAVPYNNRVKLSLIMDAPMDVSLTPQKLLGYQQTWLNQESMVDQENQKEVAIAEDMASDVQKLMG